MSKNLFEEEFHALNGTLSLSEKERNEVIGDFVIDKLNEVDTFVVSEALSIRANKESFGNQVNPGNIWELRKTNSFKKSPVVYIQTRMLKESFGFPYFSILEAFAKSHPLDFEQIKELYPNAIGVIPGVLKVFKSGNPDGLGRLEDSDCVVIRQELELVIPK